MAELTELQQEVFDFVSQGLSYAEISNILGINYDTARKRYRDCVKKGFEADRSARPTGSTKSFFFKDDQGNSRALHMKASKAEEAKKTIKDISDYITKSVTARPKIKRVKHANDDMLYNVLMPELHIGLRCWHKESGDDYGLDIAEQLALEAYNQHFANIPKGSHVVLSDNCDFFHFAGPNYMTGSGRNFMDTDGQWGEVFQRGMDLWVKIIDMAAKKFGKIDVYRVQGNHCPLPSWMLDRYLLAWYRNCNQVNINAVDTKYNKCVWGRNILLFDHGEKEKNFIEAIPEICREEWSMHPHVVAYGGHLHHEIVKERSYLVYKRVNSIAPKDQWHSWNYYVSRRAMQMDVFHREYGEIRTEKVSLQMIYDGINK